MTTLEVSPISSEKSRMTEMWQCPFRPLVCSIVIAMQQQCLEYMMCGFSTERYPERTEVLEAFQVKY